MKKITTLLLIITTYTSFSQILSPSGDNIFYYNGNADLIFKYPPRGSGGRAIVHADYNVLSLNFAGDFTGGTRIGNDVYFKDGGNSFINSGNFGIGTATPTGTLELKKSNSNLVFDLDTNGISRMISKGWNANIDMHTFQINGVENFDQLHLNTNGNVGIGNSSPDAPLTVYGISNFYPIRIGGGDARQFSIKHYFSNPNFISNEYPVVIGTGGGNQPLVLDAARIGIGTSNPSAMLTVAGNIASREVKVTVDAGADFVFENNYNLPSLESVDQFIKENKHLPEIASAKEMQQDGINLSEMNIKLLQKIEEMTLYMINQNEKMKNLENRLEKFEKKTE